MKILIGRGVSSGLNLKVDDSFNLVSRKHAKIIYNEKEEFILEDLNSTNGTFVNGKSISKKKINKKDSVLLGSKIKTKAYVLDINKLIIEINKEALYAKTDYSKEFDLLEKVYLRYIREIAKNKKKFNLKSQLPKLIASGIIGLFLILAISFNWIPKDLGTLQYPIILLLMVVVGTLTSIGKKNDINDTVTDIQIKYSDKYCCPKCNKKLQLSKAWKLYKNDVECPYKCGAKYD